MINDDDESRDSAAIRTLLFNVDSPPGRLTTDALLGAGRKVRRRRRSMTAVAGVFGLSLATVAGVGAVNLARADPAIETTPFIAAESAASAAPPANCTVEELPLPAKATSAEVNAGSPSGRFLAGFSAVGESLATPVFWDGTRAESIKLTGTGEAQDVNDSGVVVGEAQSASGRSFAWAYTGGKVIKLPIPKGYTGAEATAINATGQVAGVLFTPNGTAAAVWRSVSANAEVNVLDAPGAATAFGISDDGVVVGQVGEHAYRWDAQGRGSSLAEPAGSGGSGALGVRGEWAYGRAPRNIDTAVPPPTQPDDSAPPTGMAISPACRWCGTSATARSPRSRTARSRRSTPGARWWSTTPTGPYRYAPRPVRPATCPACPARPPVMRTR